MKKIKYLDPSIERKNISNSNFQLLKGTSFPLPSEVEISESGTCNRKCSFCPRSDPDYEDIKDFIKPELHTKLIKELMEQNYRGVVRYSGFVEPLLDKNIYNLILETKSNLPSARVEMVTNGDVLNSKRLKKLFKSGLDTILVSVYDGPEDAEMFENMCMKAKLKKNQFVIRHRYFNEDKDFGLTISNRAGMMKNAEYKIKPLEKELKQNVFIQDILFLWITMEMFLCVLTIGEKIILGNLNTQNFKEIWLSKKAISLRKNLTKEIVNFPHVTYVMLMES